MIRYRFTQPAADVAPGQTPKVATLTMNTTEPRGIVDLEFEGDREVIDEVKINLEWSWGTRGRRMTVNRSTPIDLLHAIHACGQVDEFNPERILDTVEWEGGKPPGE